MGDTSSNITPAPIVYSASQDFIGNDGKWSSFVVRVGSPSQSFQVLPSSTSGEIFVPIVDGCQRLNFTNCGPLRGAYDFKGRTSNGFLANSSSTWQEIGIYEMDVREDLNFTANGLYGLDRLGLMIENSGGPTLSNQVIGGVASPKIWVGMVGLGQKPANFSEFENPQTSFISSLKDEKMIPSKSYGYTAGAYYKTPKGLASLTLGGYDQSKFTPNNISFPFDPNDDRLLSLNLQSIVAHGSFNASRNLLDLMETPIYVDIDYTVPHLWLPKIVCDNFASEFQLEYDNSTDLYLVNDTIHTKLQQMNPTVTIGLGATADPAQRVNVVLPYSAFDLQASHPIYSNTTNYFPIRRAQNASMYTLGRTFMQEAYIKVDYERGNFSVHQALFPATNEKQEIVPIRSIDATASPKIQKRNLSPGIIACIVIVDILVLCLIVFTGLWLMRRRNRRRILEQEQNKEVPNSGNLSDDSRREKDGDTIFEVDGSGGSELEIDGSGLSELQDRGLQVDLYAGTRYELSGGEVSYEMGSSRTMTPEEVQTVLSSPRKFSFDSNNPARI